MPLQDGQGDGGMVGIGAVEGDAGGAPGQAAFLQAAHGFPKIARAADERGRKSCFINMKLFVGGR